MKSTSKTLTILGIALAFTMVAGGVYMYFFAAMRSKTEATALLFANLEELSGKETRALSAATTIRNESTNIEKLSTYFIKESGVVSFAKSIEALGPQAGTGLVIQSLEPGVTEKAVPFLSFRIRATGKFADISKLLVLLENLPGRFEWRTVRLSMSDTSGQVAGVTGKNIPAEWSAEILLNAVNFVKE